jgi:DNA-binding HxlR family transcriptional regulator
LVEGQPAVCYGARKIPANRTLAWAFSTQERSAVPGVLEITAVAKCKRLGYVGPCPIGPFADQNCSIAGALAVVGERWTLLVLREVLLGRRRFREIQRQTGVATNILTDRLATLVDHGVLVRERSDDQPETSEYVPTRKALDVQPVLAALMQWGDRYVNGERAPRVMVDTTCGHDADPFLTCAHCGQRVKPEDLRVRPGPGADDRQRAEPLLP